LRAPLIHRGGRFAFRRPGLICANVQSHDPFTAISRVIRQEDIMAKGQLRSNKEAKKPKQAKAKPNPGAALNWASPKTPAPVKSGEKK
jgi:hypothetical protein